MNLPSFALKKIQGGIGKQIVVKHYGKKIVVTKFPDMEGIIASSAQRERRTLFKEATAYAREVYHDPVLKNEWQMLTGKKAHLFGAIVGGYMKGKG